MKGIPALGEEAEDKDLQNFPAQVESLAIVTLKNVFL